MQSWIPFQGLDIGGFVLFFSYHRSKVMQRSEHLCQQQLRVPAAVWGHYAEVQVLANVLSPNNPRLKARPREVRQKVIIF